MKITRLTRQTRNLDRVNVFIDGSYALSLDVAQIIDLGVKVGKELDDDERAQLEEQSQFGKVYARTLEYALVRPRSIKELREYLYKKTMQRMVISKKTGQKYMRPGVPVGITDLVLDRLIQKGYVDDTRFAQWWVQTRNLRKGSSLRRLRNELMTKGVEKTIIDETLQESERSDAEEIQKLIQKKQSKYQDRDKLVAYLARQGFSYDDIRSALDSVE